MEMKDSGWKYYLPENGEDIKDATPIHCWSWYHLEDAEDAAEMAAEDEWDNRDGWEAGLGAGPTVVVVSPQGHETVYSTDREAEVKHRVLLAKGFEDD